jgi:hypothetical protein
MPSVLFLFWFNLQVLYNLGPRDIDQLTTTSAAPRRGVSAGEVVAVIPVNVRDFCLQALQETCTLLSSHGS